MKTKQSKSFDYGGSSFAVVESAATANIVVDTEPSYLPLPTTDDEFFAIEGATNRITFKRKGYVNISFTAKINTSDEMDLQIVSNRGAITRKNFTENGSILIEFGFEVQDVASDWLVIQMQDTLSGFFLYKAEDAARGLIAQPPFTIHLAFTDDLDRADDSIGELFFSADGTLAGKTNVLKLWGEVILMKADYPILWSKLQGTAMVIDIDINTFKIKDMANSRYLAAGGAIAIETQNLPQHSHPLSANGSAGVAEEIGRFHIEGENVSGADLTAFEIDYAKYNAISSAGSTGAIVQGAGGSYSQKTHVVLSDFVRPLYGDTDLVNDTTYTSTTEVRPNTLQTFLYIRCDRI